MGAGRGRSSSQPASSSRGRGVSARTNAVARPSNNHGSYPSIGQSNSQVFSAEQWKALAGFIGNTKIPDDRLTCEFDCHMWIIDTGASRHVTCIDSWLHDVQQVSCPVGLPNGKTMTATKEGSVYLSSKIILKNILFAPELQ